MIEFVRSARVVSRPLSAEKRCLLQQLRCTKGTCPGDACTHWPIDSVTAGQPVQNLACRCCHRSLAVLGRVALLAAAAVLLLSTLLRCSPGQAVVPSTGAVLTGNTVSITDPAPSSVPPRRTGEADLERGRGPSPPGAAQTRVYRMPVPPPLVLPPPVLLGPPTSLVVAHCSRCHSSQQRLLPGRPTPSQLAHRVRASMARQAAAAAAAADPTLNPSSPSEPCTTGCPCPL
jgi:hypothetical protein